MTDNFISQEFGVDRCTFQEADVSSKADWEKLWSRLITKDLKKRKEKEKVFSLFFFMFTMMLHVAFTAEQKNHDE